MMMFLAFMNVGGQELILILLIVLVLFGAKKLPELARGMGQAMKEFQKAKDEFSDELHSSAKTDIAANPDFIKNWIEMKQKEYDTLRLRPHPYEFAMYFDV